jgi:hypothetical protein
MAGTRCSDAFDPSRKFRTPVFKCPHCGHVGEGGQPHVSVRAMLLSLVRFGIADAEKIKELEKRWALYRTAE